MVLHQIVTRTFEVGRMNGSSRLAAPTVLFVSILCESGLLDSLSFSNHLLLGWCLVPITVVASSGGLSSHTGGLVWCRPWTCTTPCRRWAI